MKRQQGILHAENAVGLCFLCLKILIYINKYLFCLRCCGIQNPPCPPHSAVGANMSSEVGTSSEVQISLSLQRWNVIITRGIVLQYSIFLFGVLFPIFFFAVPRSQSVRGWPVRLAEFSLIEIRREVPTLATVVSCLTESWRTAATNFYAQSPIFCVLCGAIGTGGNGWLLLVWPTGSWHVRAQDTKYLDLLDSIPPNGFPH